MAGRVRQYPPAAADLPAGGDRAVRRGPARTGRHVCLVVKPDVPSPFSLSMSAR